MRGNIHKSQSAMGIGLVEAVVVVSIISVAFAAVLSSAVFFLRAGIMAGDRAQAMYLAEEGIESVRFLRDQSYSANIAPRIGTGVWYVEPTASGVSATTTNNPIFGSFTRTLELESVYRKNSDDDIIPLTSGDPKTLDPGTALLTVHVTWSGGDIERRTYVTDLYEN